MSDKLIPVYKNGELISVRSDKVMPVYKNGIGIHEILNEMQRQANEMKRLKEK